MRKGFYFPYIGGRIHGLFVISLVWCYGNINMSIKQSEQSNPESIPNDDVLLSKDPFPTDDDMILQKRKEAYLSKATSDTRGTRLEQEDISSIKEEAVSLSETAVAKAKVHKMHGKNYGRSLTLEMEDDALPLFTSKWIWMVLLGAVVLGIVGFTFFASNGNPGEVKPSRAKSKIKVRRASKK